MTDLPEHEWKISRRLFEGENSFTLSSLEHGRKYEIGLNAMPGALQKRFKAGAHSVYFRGAFDGIGLFIVGPVEVLEGRKW